MFYSLTGNVIKIWTQATVIECGGVGFKVNTSMNTLKHISMGDSAVTLYTYLAVREDALDLFGFYDEDELECFKLLISVSGVGPKAALAILSQMTPSSLAAAVAKGDAKSVTRAQGVGPKIAERVVRELKGKLAAADFIDDDSDFNADSGLNEISGSANEAISALQFLGYSQAEASRAVSMVNSASNVEELIKKALNILSSGL